MSGKTKSVFKFRRKSYLQDKVDKNHTCMCLWTYRWHSNQSDKDCSYNISITRSVYICGTQSQSA